MKTINSSFEGSEGLAGRRFTKLICRIGENRRQQHLLPAIQLITHPLQRQPSAPLPKFVIRCSTLGHELRKRRGTSNDLILVPLFDLKFLIEIAANGAGTSNRRH
jgi:hypothetical protein